MTKDITFFLIRGPYDDESVYTALRLAQKARERKVNVNFFFYLTSTIVGNRGQKPAEYPPIEELVRDILKKGLKNPKADAIACIKCTDARGVTDSQTEGVIIGGLYDLMEWIRDTDKTIMPS